MPHHRASESGLPRRRPGRVWAVVLVIRPPMVRRHGVAPTRGVGAWNPHRLHHALHRVAAGVADGGAAPALDPVVAGGTDKVPAGGALHVCGKP